MIVKKKINWFKKTIRKKFSITNAEHHDFENVKLMVKFKSEMLLMLWMKKYLVIHVFQIKRHHEIKITQKGSL